MNTPLAEILRPKTLDDYIGQQHLVGQGAVLRTMIDGGIIPSMILWGPPGIGKTTLATIISHTLKRPFHSLSAINSGVKDVRDVIDTAKSQYGAILFIDEIHRFSKSQQDSLLGAVEKGIITLIGATTENPSFEVNSALLSRCQVYVLKEFGAEEMSRLLDSAVKYYASTGRRVVLQETEALMRISGGDARKLLNALELVVNSTSDAEVVVTNKSATEVIQNNLATYDKQGEMHYDLVSAFIKSMRGSDPNAAIYYMTRMMEGGEDPVFIARRMLIFASEDITNANPNALLLANACFDAVTKIGYPECKIILAQTAVYLASSPKSNTTYNALHAAEMLIRQTGDLPVPLPIRNAPTKLMKELGYHEGYQYPHDYPGNFSGQEYLPEAIRGTCLYQPGNNPREQETRRQLHEKWKGKYGY